MTRSLLISAALLHIALPGGYAHQSVKPAPIALSIKGGERISLAVSLETGAATLQGKITVSGDSPLLPASPRVYLIPVDPAHANNSLRFADTSVKPGGAFKLTHLAPGEYKLFALPAVESAGQQLAETREGRALLRRAAQKDGVGIQLRSCQRIEDFLLRYSEGHSKQ